MATTPAYADFSIKARCVKPEDIEKKLAVLNARFVGEDFQTDTYFEVAVGKLKLREGNIENLITHYLREPHDGKMRTTVFLYERDPDDAIMQKYTQSRSIIGKVVKRRKIYWIGNVKFHVDRVEGCGAFVEIEAIDVQGRLGVDAIRSQAEEYRELLSIREEDILNGSYIDMK